MGIAEDLRARAGAFRAYAARFEKMADEVEQIEREVEAVVPSSAGSAKPAIADGNERKRGPNQAHRVLAETKKILAEAGEPRHLSDIRMLLPIKIERATLQKTLDRAAARKVLTKPEKATYGLPTKKRR